MKNRYLAGGLIVLIVFGCLAATAQPRNAYKTTTDQSRLVANVVAFYDGVSYAAYDSTFNIYLTGRGYSNATHSFQYDTSYTWHYNSVTLTYTNKAMVVNTYSGNNLSTSLSMQWDAPTSSWLNQHQTFMTYDANNNNLTALSQNWNSTTSSWVNTVQYVYTYDANNNQLTYLAQTWDAPTSSWKNSSLTSYTYDSNNNMIMDLYQTWVSGAWQNSSKDNYVYNTANLRTSYVRQNWDVPTSAWKNSYKSLMTYDVSNNMTNYRMQSWNSTLSVWQDVNQTNYTYNASNDMVNGIHQNWNATTSTWDNDYQTIYTHDLYHNELSDITQSWNGTTSVWENSHRTTSSYNSFNQVTVRTNDTWNTGGFWQPVLTDMQNRNYYETYTPAGAEMVKNEPVKINVYPSPANDYLKIDLNWKSAQPATIAIYDIGGKLWMQWQALSADTYHTTITTSQLPAGYYVIKISGKTESAVTKFSIAH